MNLSRLKTPEYIVEVHKVSIKFPPFIFGSDQLIGYYESESLALRVWEIFHKHFMVRIKGGVDVFCAPCLVKVVKISGEWCFKDAAHIKIETAPNPDKIQACLVSLTEYAKKIRIPVILDLNGTEKLEDIFKDYPSSNKRAEAEADTKSEQKEIDHEAELQNLGFISFTGKESLQRAYRKWALDNHPDKKPEGPEREAADSRFRTMRKHYNAVLKLRGWDD